LNINQTNNPFLSIVIPAFNEASRVKRSIQDIRSFLTRLPKETEVIVVIEKSSDGTAEIAENLTKDDSHFQIVVSDVQRGKGYAVKTGMLKAKGEIVFFMDLDLSTPLVEIFKFLGHFESNPETDIVIGSRQHEESEIIKKQHPVRQNMGHVFNLFVQMLAFKGINDTQCGFKAFRKRSVFPLFSRQKTDGFSFDVEILLLARAIGFKIDVLPVKWVNAPGSKVRIVRDSSKMFFDLIRVKSLVKKTLKTNPYK